MEANQVLQALKHESLLRAKRQRRFQVFVLVCVSVPVLMLLMGLIGSVAHVGPIAHRPLSIDDLLGTFGVLGLLGSYVGLSSNQKQLTKEAAMIREPKAVPYLIEALGSGDKDLAAVAKEALAKILPYLTAEEASELKVDWKSIVTHAGPKDAGLQLSTIEAIRKIGGKNEVAYLDTYGQGLQPSGVGKVEEKVRVNALSASADLRMRLARVAIDQKAAEVDKARQELGLE